VRITDGLLARLFAAQGIAGQGNAIGPLASQYVTMHPESPFGLRLAANGAAALGDWGSAKTLLTNLRGRSGDSDFRLLGDLSLAQLRAGNKAAARDTALSAYRLQRGSAMAAQAYAMALVANGEKGANVRRLLDKAEALGGSNPLLRETRRQLTAR
jgi:hypothetical protein